MKKKIKIMIITSVITCGVFGIGVYAENPIKSVGVIAYEDETHKVKFDYRDLEKIQTEINNIGELGESTSTGDIKIVNDKIAAYAEHCK